MVAVLYIVFDGQDTFGIKYHAKSKILNADLYIVLIDCWSSYIEMNTERLSRLLEHYEKAPREFHATSYWQSYEKRILETISDMEIKDIWSGKYPVLATFGFGSYLFHYHSNLPFWKKIVRKIIHSVLIKNRKHTLPYDLDIEAIRDMSYHHCELKGKLATAKDISTIGASSFGNHEDIFDINGRQYTLVFLSRYLRYCFAHQYMKLEGNEIIVELGSGSGVQIEVLKKLYPDLTVLCFDLPAQIFLCEAYLTEAIGNDCVVSTSETVEWTDLSQLKNGYVHFFGNWLFPLVSSINFDIFWNAASFGEMEPTVVDNYLSYIRGRARYVYLLQARIGKEKTGQAYVNEQITFEDYNTLLAGYDLLGQQDAYLAHKRLSDSGGYFEGMWRAKDYQTS